MTAPKKWDPDPSDPALVHVLHREGDRIRVDLKAESIPHEAGGVLRASKTTKGAVLLELLGTTKEKALAEAQRDQEQEREALAAGRTVYAGTIKGGTK